MTEWRHTTLGSACQEGGGFIRTGPFGAQLHQSDYVDDPNGIPVVMPKDMSDGRIDLKSIARIGRETAARLSDHLLVAGDIVLSRRGDVGRSVWVTEEDLPVLCGTGSMRIHPGDDGPLQPQFLRYVMRSKSTVDYLEGHAVGATMPNLNAGIVAGLPLIVLPPDQQKMVGQILSTIEDLIENNRQRIETLEQMAQAIYREWFVRFRYPNHENVPLVDSALGPIPEGWEIKNLFDIADVGFGFSFKSKPFAALGPYPVVRIRDVLAGTTKTFTDEEAEDRYRVKDGDVLIGMDGDFHLAQWTGGEAWLNQRVARLRPHESLSARHLLLAIEEPVKQWNSAISGTTVAHLGKRHLEQVEVLVPAPDVLTMASEVLDSIANQERLLVQSSRQLSAARDLLLPRLVTGRIDVSSFLDTVVESVA